MRSTFLPLFAVAGAALSVTEAGAQQRKSRPQFGAAIEWRSQIGSLPDTLDRRTGLAIRLFADGDWMRYVGWRVEGAYTQARYNRSGETGTVIPVTESGYELGGFMRTMRSPGSTAKWTPYVVGGGVVSLRGTCSLDDGFSYDAEIRCADATTIRIGWGAGGGIRMAAGLGGWDWFAEARVLSNVTSASGGRLITIGFGAGM